MIVAPFRTVALATALMFPVSAAAAQANPCALLTSAEATKHIGRGKPTYNETPEAMPVRGGALCEYGFGGQVGLWNSSQDLDQFLKSFRMDKVTRHPVSGVGDRAWIMYPPAEDQYKERVAYLAAHVGQKVVTISLVARNGAADGVMGQVCRGDQSRLKPDEREDCKKILANTSETQESLAPAVTELARLVVAKVRAGK